MRVMGTEKGTRVVELTLAECDALESLMKTLDGGPPFAFEHHHDMHLSGDLDKAFLAIQAWINGKYYIGEMRKWLDRMEVALDSEKGKSEIVKEAL